MVLTEKMKDMLMLVQDKFTIVSFFPLFEYILLKHWTYHYNLEKVNKYDGCLINKRVLLDKVSLETRKRAASRAKIRELAPYVEKLVNHVDENLLKDMYRNLSTVNFKRRRLPILIGIAGMYDSEDNKLSYVFKSAIGHELLHLASNCYHPKSKENQTGFRQGKGTISIGRGLNEGYTELLASRIFNKNGEVDSYYKEVRIAKLFEFFFDDPKDMEKYYFRHNLPGFILYMQKFIPISKIRSILFDLDYINSLSNFSPLITPIKNVKISMELYKYFLKTNPSVKKRLAFEKVLRENKIVELALDQEKYKLQRNIIPFDNSRVTSMVEEVRQRRVA
ncbi:MAG: hypothetical protein K2I70_03505 [Bacilli bacterium]|nr:hypothetical protein [Bacilli bacterium]